MNHDLPQTPTDAEARLLDELNERLVHRARSQELIEIDYRVIDSPLGNLLLARTDAGLVRVAFESEDLDSVLEQLARKVSPRIMQDVSSMDAEARQFDEYFNGRRRVFDLEVDLQLSTDFRRLVQLTLGQIGYGQTWSYRDMAQHIGRPKAVRAVGTACATNPLPIVLPCHRVVRTDGSLGGYLGGLAAKERLLHLENPDYRSSDPALF